MTAETGHANATARNTVPGRVADPVTEARAAMRTTSRTRQPTSRPKTRRITSAAGRVGVVDDPEAAVEEVVLVEAGSAEMQLIP